LGDNILSYKRKKNVIIMKASILIFILITTTCTNFTLADSSISKAEEIADYVLNQLSYNKDELLIFVWGPLSSGEEIHSVQELIITTPEKGYIIFIDLYPRANLHQVQYVFLSERTYEIIVIDAFSPPNNFNDYQMIETKMGEIFKSAENRRAPIPDIKKPGFVQYPNDPRWAVLMNGGHSQYSNHVRYWNDLSNIYITLNYVYGYPDEQIIVLCSDGLDPAPDQSNGLNSDPDLDGDGDDDIMYSCVLSNVDKVFADLANNLTGGNELFVFTTDHGNTQGGWDSIQNLWNMEELTDDHFADLLENLSVHEIVCTFEPCFSGGFLDDVVVPPGPIAASSACRHDEYSWAMSNLEYDEYVFHWTAAVKGEDAYGDPVDADFNGDGKITMDEAYEYAVEMDEADESPQYGDYPEGCGSEISLEVGNLPPEIPQKPSGESEGVTKVEYTFSSSTTDPEGEQIFYLFDWGDNTTSEWLGPYNSGTTVHADHVWNEEGDYEIKVLARDINGSESGWSDPHSIYILKAPYVRLHKISGGFFTVNGLIRNLGEVEAINVEWSLDINGGTILFGRESNGVIASIPPYGEVTFESKPIIGFGKVTVKAQAKIPENTGEKINTGFVYLFFIQVNPSGS
jgi:hypothetical protein